MPGIHRTTAFSHVSDKKGKQNFHLQKYKKHKFKQFLQLLNRLIFFVVYLFIYFAKLKWLNEKANIKDAFYFLALIQAPVPTLQTQ